MRSRKTLVLGLLLLAILLGGALFFLRAPEAPEVEFAPGPARRHSPSAMDTIARVASRALDAAAGTADRRPTSPVDLIPSGQEWEFFEAVNKDRVAHGLGALEFEGALLPIARMRAAAQNGGPLSHFDGFGQMAFVGLLADSNVPYSLAGENLARATRSDPAMVARLQQSLMNSPTHRANILDPAFARLAVGEAEEGSRGAATFAQIFVAGPQ